MPKIDAATLRVPVIIAGYGFTCPQPYQAGHCLSEGEAEALNIVFADRVKTNMARAVKDAEANSGRELIEFLSSCQEGIDDYASRYSFSLKSDPIRRKALELAMDSISTQAAQDKHILSGPLLRSKAEAVLASGRYPQFLEQARKFVELQREIAEEELR